MLTVKHNYKVVTHIQSLLSFPNKYNNNNNNIEINRINLYSVWIKIYGRLMDRSVLQVWLYCRSLWLSKYAPKNFIIISHVHFSNICGMICELHFDGSLLNHISVQYVERYVGHMEQPIFSFSQGCTNPRHQVARTPTFFLKWHPSFMDPQCGICFM